MALSYPSFWWLKLWPAVHKSSLTHMASKAEAPCRLRWRVGLPCLLLGQTLCISGQVDLSFWKTESKKTWCCLGSFWKTVFSCSLTSFSSAHFGGPPRHPDTTCVGAARKAGLHNHITLAMSKARRKGKHIFDGRQSLETNLQDSIAAVLFAPCV